MPTPNREIEVLDHLLRYVADELSLREFNEWLAPVTFDVLRRGDLSERRLVSRIEALLAEFSASGAAESELREEFLELSRLDELALGDSAVRPTMVTSTSSRLVSDLLDFRWPGSRSQLGEAFG